MKPAKILFSFAGTRSYVPLRVLRRGYPAYNGFMSPSKNFKQAGRIFFSFDMSLKLYFLSGRVLPFESHCTTPRLTKLYVANERETLPVLGMGTFHSMVGPFGSMENT